MTPMPFADLERVYQDLAEAIDRAGPANESVFLTKLVMTLAHRLGSIETFHESLGLALEDLPVRTTPG